MKKDIHPTVYKAKIICACGNEIEALSCKGERVQVEICSNTAGRIDRFRKKYAKFQENA